MKNAGDNLRGEEEAVKLSEADLWSLGWSLVTGNPMQNPDQLHSLSSAVSISTVRLIS